MQPNTDWVKRRIKRWYHHWLFWAVLVLAVGAILGWPKAKRRYQRWHAARQVRHAEELIASGDFRHALLEARGALEVNPMDPRAVRIIARALEEAGSVAAAAQWRSRLDSITPGDQKNILAWASDSLKSGDAVAAARILSMLKPEPMNDPGYHATAAEVAMAKQDLAGAELHWAEAARLDPQEDRYRLRLAILRLGSRKAGTHDGAVETLRELSLKTPKNLEALRALLADATNYRDWGKGLEFANALVAAPGATFPDKLMRLATLRAVESREATEYLMGLRNGTLSSPDDLYLLLMWMNQHDLALMVAEWARTLPPEVLGAPPVCVAVADAYARDSDWKKLSETVEGRAWGEWDYLRRAFLARALERLDDAEQSAQEWNDAVSAARSLPRSEEGLERLARIASSWNWDVRAEEVMRMLAGTPGCPRWVLGELWSMSLERAEAAQLQKLIRAFAQADPKSTDLRTRFAFFSLLVHSEEGNPDREAEKLFVENPGNGAIAVTRGLSLFQQGKFAEALAVTAGLPPEELQKPDVALYHAIFLTANREADKAAGFFKAAEKRKMFAEEKALLERAKVAAARAAGASDVAEAVKAARAARAVQAAETDAAVKAARAARAAEAAKGSKAAGRPSNPTK